MTVSPATTGLLSPVDQYDDGRLSAPAARRNSAALSAAVRPLLLPGVRVLELASGTGEHAALLVNDYPEIVWQPTEIDEMRLRSIVAWKQYCGSERLLAPVRLDVASRPWPMSPQQWDMIFTANLLHVLPIEWLGGLLEECHRVLRIGGRLCIYGPFVDGAQTFSLGNEEFDARLRKANPSLGLRDMGMLAELAEQVGLTMAEPLRMPANNHLLIFERRS